MFFWLLDVGRSSFTFMKKMTDQNLCMIWLRVVAGHADPDVCCSCHATKIFLLVLVGGRNYVPSSKHVEIDFIKERRVN